MSSHLPSTVDSKLHDGRRGRDYWGYSLRALYVSIECTYTNRKQIFDGSRHRSGDTFDVGHRTSVASDEDVHFSFSVRQHFPLKEKLTSVQT